MISNLWNTLLYEPMLNLLAAISAVMPGADVGIAIIILTIIVKIVIFPLTQKSIHSQNKVKMLDPELRKIKIKYKTKEEQARKTMDLYKANKVNPFSGILLALVQIPIIFALYKVAGNEIDFSRDSMYSFISVPEHVNTSFLGIIDIKEKSAVLAFLAGVSQYFFGMLSIPKSSLVEGEDPNSFKNSFARSMNIQFRYILPVVIIFIAYTLPSALALYWITSNIFSIGQYWYANKISAKNKDISVIPAS